VKNPSVSSDCSLSMIAFKYLFMSVDGTLTNRAVASSSGGCCSSFSLFSIYYILVE
jgi:hypothetical protein